jgi:hypothetical protein
LPLAAGAGWRTNFDGMKPITGGASEEPAGASAIVPGSISTLMSSPSSFRSVGVSSM